MRFSPRWVSIVTVYVFATSIHILGARPNFFFCGDDPSAFGQSVGAAGDDTLTGASVVVSGIVVAACALESPATREVVTSTGAVVAGGIVPVVISVAGTGSLVLEQDASRIAETASVKQTAGREAENEWRVRIEINVIGWLPFARGKRLQPYGPTVLRNDEVYEPAGNCDDLPNCFPGEKRRNFEVGTGRRFQSSRVSI